MATKKQHDGNSFALGTVWGITAPQTTSQPGTVIATAAPAVADIPEGWQAPVDHGDNCTSVFKSVPALIRCLESIKGQKDGLDIRKIFKKGARFQRSVPVGTLLHIDDVDAGLAATFHAMTVSTLKMRIRCCAPYYGSEPNMQSLYFSGRGVLLYHGRSEDRKDLGVLIRDLAFMRT